MSIISHNAAACCALLLPRLFDFITHHIIFLVGLNFNDFSNRLSEHMIFECNLLALAHFINDSAQAVLTHIGLL